MTIAVSEMIGYKNATGRSRHRTYFPINDPRNLHVCRRLVALAKANRKSIEEFEAQKVRI